MLKNLFIACVLCFISLSHNIIGSDYIRATYPFFINYRIEDGLSNNIINDIIQDSRGFIWFATENGLSRFDGYEFVNYYHNPEDTLSLPGNIITSLSIDDDDNLWIGTTEGLCRLSLKTDSIKRYMAEAGNLNTPRTNHIRRTLFSSGTNTLWLETLEGTLSEYELSENSWSHYSHIAVTQPYYRYHALFEDSKGNIWFGGRNTPIMKLDINIRKITTIEAKGLERKSKRDNDVGDIIETNNGTWFVVALDGIYRFFPETEEFERIFATSTYSIAEDNYGNFWFATGNGLLSYCENSDKLTHYLYNQNNPLSLVNNHVAKVYIDREGNIWAGTKDGVSLLSQKTALFEYYYNISDNPESLSSNSISALEQDEYGNLYIGTANQGLNVLNRNENSLKIFKNGPDASCTLSSNRISALYFDSHNKLWVGLWAGIGFNVFDPKTSCFEKFTYDETSLKRDWYNAFLEDDEGNMLVGMWGAAGTTFFDREKGEFLPKNFITYDKPYNRRVYKIVNDGNENIFFLERDLNILYQFDARKKEYSSHVFNAGFPSGAEYLKGRFNNLPFEFSIISNAVSDNEGLTVFATDKGIFGYKRVKGFFEIIRANMEPTSIAIIGDKLLVLEKYIVSEINLVTGKTSIIKLETDEQFKLINTVNEELFVLANDDSFLIINQNTNETHNIKQIPVSSTSENLNIIAIIKDEIWAGYRNGLYVYSIDSLLTKNNEYLPDKIFDAPVSSLAYDEYNNKVFVFTPLGIYSVDPANKIWSIFRLKNITNDFNKAAYTATLLNRDTIWMGNESGHFQIIISSGELINTSLPDDSRVSSHLTTSLLQDFDGNYWIGTSDMGLNKVDKQTKQITHFYTGENVNSLPGNSINDLMQSSDGKIWIATEKGLSYFEEGEIIIVEGLIEQNPVFSLTESPSGTIWAATSIGLAKIDQINNIQLFDESDGLPAINFTNASIVTKNQKLVFGTKKGFFIFDPLELKSLSKNNNQVWISQLSIFDKPERYQFKKNDVIELHHSDNFFQLHFSASSFGLKPGTTFKYKLSDVDPDWVKTTSNNVSYTNIPPGKYLFKVTQVLNDGTISEDYASLKIVIPPPFYRTLWFRALIVMLIISGLLAYLFVYIRQIRTERLNIELSQKLLALQMNPHFIFNSLTAIQSFMYTNNPEEAGNFLSSFSRLVRLIMENTRSDYISIKNEIKTLELYLMIQKLRFPDKLDYEINVSQETRDSNILVPPMLAQPFIENSIEHGILHKDGKGHINIYIDILKKAVKIVVEDDGVGIERSRQINEGKRVSHISHATSITRDRIKNLSNNRKNIFGIKIVDLKEKGSQGTLVELMFPYKVDNNPNKELF